MYNIFISHSWSYSDQYLQLCNLLDAASYFKYKNYSVPKDDPFRIHSQHYKTELENKIRNQMKYASVVVILAGVYASYSESIDMEIRIATELDERILAIEPFGAEKTSLKVKVWSDKVVRWSTESIVNAIRELGKDI